MSLLPTPVLPTLHDVVFSASSAWSSRESRSQPALQIATACELARSLTRNGQMPCHFQAPVCSSRLRREESSLPTPRLAISDLQTFLQADQSAELPNDVVNLRLRRRCHSPRQVYVNGLQGSKELVAPTLFPASVASRRPAQYRRLPPTPAPTAYYYPYHATIYSSQPNRAWRRAAEHRHLVAANSPQLCQLQSPVGHALLSSLTSDARNTTMAIREFDLRQSAIQLQEMKQANSLKRRIFPVSAGLNGQQAMRPYEPPRTMTAPPPVIGNRNPAANLLFLRIQRGVEGVEDERRRASPPPFASCAHSFHDAC
ncbi:hypothetical protein CPLU01_09154 [Colletotrichum plurivorum]|uniref:Uncharacterized protein n=1 Tax=Colletotrichum plurivorum TaxID=2175906 RepID=A0A8H6K9V9_9PEZI|nr:hypothetical protein CPLU01_09154 [Colletotrichum plurivorum]